MLFVSILIIIYALPVCAGIQITSWSLKKRGRANASMWFRKISFSALGILIIGGLLYYYFITHHTIRFKVDHKYEVKLTTAEPESFLEWPIEFSIQIKDIKTNKINKFGFTTREGPTIKILLNKKNDKLFLLQGVEYNKGTNWIIDLKKETIEQDDIISDYQLLNYHLIGELTNEFEWVGSIQ